MQSYSVTVRTASLSKGQPEEHSLSSERDLTWHPIANLVRVAGQVAKETLLCYVVFPDDPTAASLPVKEQLQALQIYEQLIRRWIPEKERDLVPESKGAS